MWDESKPRVFISYSHQNSSAYAVVRDALDAAGFHPWSDRELAAGRGFTDEIQRKIAHSHLFLPILTPESHLGGWVHQEIGFAVGLKIPCVPLCIGEVPYGMIAMKHAIVLNDLNAQELRGTIERAKFKNLVESAAKPFTAPSDCVQEAEDRADKIVQYADEALDHFGPCNVRIQGGLGSFSLPDAPDYDDVWKARYGCMPRTPSSYKKFREERRSLERHAQVAELRMLLNIGLDYDGGGYGEGATRTRMSILLEFLESLKGPAANVQIALVTIHPPDLMLSVGDWFIAESSSARMVRGVVQTVFTVHAPSVGNRLAEFDRHLNKTLAKLGCRDGDSLPMAISQLREKISTLPRHPAWSGDP